MKAVVSVGRALVGALVIAWCLAGVALVAGPAHAQPAPKSPTSFGGETAAPTGKPRTTEEAFERCVRDVERLETDAIGVPFLAAGYIAFFAIPVVFLVLAGVRQRRLEGEMSELKARLARLQEGPGGPTP